MDHPGRWWQSLADGRIRCDLCPRECKLRDGQRAFCYVRRNVGGRMVLTTYGLSTGFCIDPIEKKPLNHFYPGTSVLSFGTAGCNLGCRFCQNWSMSKARQVARGSDAAEPLAIAQAAERGGCRSVAFTYNDPIVFAEYAIDAARACRERGIATVAVTSGYIRPEARKEFFAVMDGANVDLKAFTDEFYRRQCFGRLAPVLDTLVYLKNETNTWFEVTTLLIPGRNDSPSELERLVGWFAENLGPKVPLHFTAFHPDYKVRDIERTPHALLARARELALAAGLRHVYTGNVHDPTGQSTYCASCGATLIRRVGYQVDAGDLNARNACGHCNHPLAGRFDGPNGTWSSLGL